MDHSQLIASVLAKYRGDVNVNHHYSGAPKQYSERVKSVLKKCFNVFHRRLPTTGDAAFIAFVKNLTENRALIAGGFICSCIITSNRHLNSFVRRVVTGEVDIDVYVSSEDAASFVKGLEDMGFVSGEGQLASIYDPSFMRQNGIAMRVNMIKVNGSSQTQIPIIMRLDVVIVNQENGRVPLDVVQNFDLTCCEAWYDGKAVTVKDANSFVLGQDNTRTCSMNPQYVPAFVRGNKFLHNRVRKYESRGFVVRIPLWDKSLEDFEFTTRRISKAQQLINHSEIRKQWIIYNFWKPLLRLATLRNSRSSRPLHEVLRFPLYTVPFNSEEEAISFIGPIEQIYSHIIEYFPELPTRLQNDIIRSVPYMAPYLSADRRVTGSEATRAASSAASRAASSESLEYSPTPMSPAPRRAAIQEAINGHSFNPWESRNRPVEWEEDRCIQSRPTLDFRIQFVSKLKSLFGGLPTTTSGGVTLMSSCRLDAHLNKILYSTTYDIRTHVVGLFSDIFFNFPLPRPNSDDILNLNAFEPVMLENKTVKEWLLDDIHNIIFVVERVVEIVVGGKTERKVNRFASVMTQESGLYNHDNLILGVKCHNDESQLSSSVETTAFKEWFFQIPGEHFIVYAPLAKILRRVKQIRASTPPSYRVFILTQQEDVNASDVVATQFMNGMNVFMEDVNLVGLGTTHCSSHQLFVTGVENPHFNTFDVYGNDSPIIESSDESSGDNYQRDDL